MSDYIIKELSIENLNEIKSLYNEYRSKSKIDYKVDVPLLPLNELKENFNLGILKGMYLKSDEQTLGFLFYFIEPNAAIELNVIHTVDENSYEIKEALINSLINILIEHKDCKVISYPMMGIQNSYADEIEKLGFDFVAQTIINLKLSKKTKFKNLSLPMEYELKNWDDLYSDEAIKIVNETFSTANDSKFDPRFLSFWGCQDVVNKITKNIYGIFIPQATTIITRGIETIGVCFINLSTMEQANVPIIAIRKAYQGKGLSKVLLAKSIEKLLKLKKAGIVKPIAINATTDTDNIPAMKMYESLGFKIDHNYKHVYFNNSQISK